MYRQILIEKEQTPLQSIVWREDPNSEIQDFELLTVTYGTKPASFLAVRCLHQLAESEKTNYPEAATIVCNNFYMDDLLAGGATKAEVIKLKGELTELLEKGGFRLRKWRSNMSICSENVHTVTEGLDIVKENETKLLGISWDPKKDMFQYEVTSKENDQNATKRVMLSQVCKLFDPLGLVGPVITAAKDLILMQTLWNLGIDWDEEVPMQVYQSWNQIRTQLCLLNELKIPRLIVSGKNNSQLQLHGFCDASERAYGACVYLHERDKHGDTITKLICSKSRVAPMRALSLPRLELCGAVLLVNLMCRVMDSLKLTIDQKFYWTDSTIVLAWINSPSRRWQMFVANRVSEIHTNSSASEWKHVDSKNNPADFISRGATPEQLMKASS
ncbi:PREDICTED: uncharacterized protein LOC108768144 [Trachymyrmex cornetzi]|uniref:uncharacterized protein LOC108768144 n=1 Tax=Trachymyrmex cornetzi TaxID=471704 RepID=UPI00084F02CE|nr:PREDICTED: uncharacterized protein LOC108768144 [Trachymyrmex cornetzi]